MTTTRSVAAALSGLLAAAAAVLGPAGTAAADDCPDVEVIFARGTGEPPGIGRVGQAFTDALVPRLGDRTLDTYAVNYPASLNFLAAASGAADASARIADMALRCPQTRLVLGGFSQGAAAVSMLAGVPPVGERIGSIGSAPPLPPASASQVAAVAVFGNPGARFGTPLSSTGLFSGRAVDVCSAGDPICSAGRDRAAHSAYELPPYPDQAASFVAALI
ncbi:cutinase family protein [Mycolicibacterium sp. CH28]|uniref:cutinase family protein n=1 Tax=Mycolicibacterium sp. CH28 TaxID=2512237 RepID=UPI0010810F30|nr:cutinase family protein [Mycolicibacterium sp. CH28]TGD86364.1 cutinase family protein [Mycolicibacterium sp. CH28]